jgi:hypothetical protein
VRAERPFEFDDIYRTQTGSFVTGENYHVVSIVDTSKTIVAITVMYGILAWYFDSILEHNRGDPKPWYFPIDPSYWLPFLRLGSLTKKYDLE